MFFTGESREQQMRWKRRFAFLPVRIGTTADGAAKMLWWDWYEDRWTGDGHPVERIWNDAHQNLPRSMSLPLTAVSAAKTPGKTPHPIPTDGFSFYVIITL